MKYKAGTNRSFFSASIIQLIVICMITGSVCVLTATEAISQNLNVATYNIFYHTPVDDENSWDNRKPHVANIIRFHNIVLWGAQEATHIQLQDLTEMLGQKYVGIGRDDGATEGEYSAILYEPNLFKVLEHDTFWLSETPNKPSTAWGANYRRICTWGKFEHIASGKTFFVYNAHFDHESQKARENSSRMVTEHIAKNTNSEDPVIFLGDLNAVPETEAYQIIVGHSRLRDAYDLTDIPPHGTAGTFNGFSITHEPARRIDHIFLSDHFSVKRYGVLTDRYRGLNYPSDHFPVLAEIEL